jgi:hypothetical protein
VTVLVPPTATDVGATETEDWPKSAVPPAAVTVMLAGVEVSAVPLIVAVIVLVPAVDPVKVAV